MYQRRVFWAAVLFMFPNALQANDFWILPEHAGKPGQILRVSVHAGDSFPAGREAVSPSRIVRFEIQGAKGKWPAQGVHVAGEVTAAEFQPRESGTYIIGAEIKPQPIQLDAASFNGYLREEGLRSILESRTKTKKENAPGRELQAKFAKALWNVGDGRDDAATRPFGFKLELIPQMDIARIRPGEKLPVLVLFEGKPLSNAQVAALSDDQILRLEGGHEPDCVTRTSYQGIAQIPIARPGTWLVRMVHMVPAAAGSESDYESFSSTLTFRVAPAGGFPLTVESIMRGEDLVGNAPSVLFWSGDSRLLYFNWQRPGESKPHAYVLDRAGGQPRRLNQEEEKKLPPRGAQFTKDKLLALFADDGDIVMLDTISLERRWLVRTSDTESNPRFTKDETNITFVRDNNLYRMALKSGEIVQLTDFRPGPSRPEAKQTESQKFLEEQQVSLFEAVREKTREKEEAESRRKEREKRKPYNIPPRNNIAGQQLSPDGTQVLFLQTERSELAKTADVPNYLTESGFTQNIPSRVKVGDIQGKSKMGMMRVETGEVIWIDHGQKEREVSLSNPQWSDDGKSLAVSATAADNKDRWILLVDRVSGTTRVLDALHDDAWVMGGFGGGFGGIFGSSSSGWMPDGQSVYFISEREGYFHLYTAAIDGSASRALTSGKFEVFSPALSTDKSKFYFTSSESHPGERHFYSMPVTGGLRTRITSMTGNSQVQLSPDEKTAALIHSAANRPPELFLMNNTPGSTARRITVTPTGEWRAFPWVEPKLITFKARDGADVYARVYTPEMLKSSPAPGRRPPLHADSKKAAAAKRPGILFVHGAGYAQNAHLYWSSYYHEYMFHHLLMDRGYVVMDVDYRGSSGYGRDWRTGIYGHMGGKDLDDEVDAAKYMADNLNVDPRRIGIYGGSYGGFITLMAMFTQPEIFAAGAALRPVTDWAHYNHPYTANILNLPQSDPEAYRRSSPIYLAEGLRGALLICHGVVDTNVHFQDTVRLAERLMELRKENWEIALYPAEDHGFKRADSWVDEYRRILRLFEAKLK